jgi:predicted aconitase with swiveling domain
MTRRGSGPDGAEEYIAAICVGGIDVGVCPSRSMASVLGSVDPETAAFVDRKA